MQNVCNICDVEERPRAFSLRLSKRSSRTSLLATVNFFSPPAVYLGLLVSEVEVGESKPDACTNISCNHPSWSGANVMRSDAV